MSWNKKLLNKANLYLILDAQVLSYQEILKVLKPAVQAGVDIVQLRDKQGSARDILEFSKKIKKITDNQALFILNDRIDLAILSKADGVHVGQHDIAYKQARKLIGSKAIIGVSCQTKEQAKEAQKIGADYLGFGSVFKTQTKPDRQPMDLRLLKAIVKGIEVPTFAIGGINLKNVKQVTDVGVRRVAVCREILLAKKVAGVVTDFKKSLSCS